MPIVYGSRAFNSDVKDSVLNAIAYFVSLFAVIFHFAVSKFVLLDQDWKYLFYVQFLWALINVVIPGKGLLFRDLTNEPLLIKLFIASFYILANSCFYYLLSVTSQFIKGVKEKHEK